ncbi:MAG TPA: extracellular solute-binding protein [Gaiellaceae bacterium]|nr:extracellular solute-binding protein [Gaiellaceae bacterium]
MRRRALVLLAGAAVALSAGCGGGSERSLVLYNGQHLELTTAFVSAFQRATGIPVKLRTDDGVVLADQILQEGHSSPADAFLTENSPELVELDEHGLLARLPQSVLAQVPPRDRAADGTWVGVALRVSSLVYNPSLLSRSQLPHSILDLARPAWKRRVALAPIDSDFPPVVGAVIATKGAAAAADWLAGLKRNADIYQTDESVVAAVNRGDVAVGVINQYYWFRLRRELGSGAMRSALYYFPSGDPGSIVNVSGAAVLASSHRHRDAERLVAFLVSRAAQQLIAHGDDFEYPARPGVSPNAALPALGGIAHTSLQAARLGDDREAVKLILRAGLGS